MQKSASPARTDPSLAGKYLTFVLAGGDFAVGILGVREIIAMHTITPLPRLPEFVRGVINLRGKIIPVMDLRLRLDLPARDNDRSTCIIVIDVATSGGLATNVGCIVDAVSEVADIPGPAIQPPPSFGNGITTDYIKGLAKLDGGQRVITLLNMDVVLSGLLRDAHVLDTMDRASA